VIHLLKFGCEEQKGKLRTGLMWLVIGFSELGEELLDERRDRTLLLILTHFSVSGDSGASPSQTGVLFLVGPGKS
jgi:hypothetical protein